MNNEKEKKLSILLRSPLFEGFSEENFDAVCEEVKPVFVSYSTNEQIIREGDVQDMLYLVVSGTVRSEKLQMEGDVHLVDMYERGEFVGLDTVSTRSRVAPVTCIADTAAELLSISADRLKNSSCRQEIDENIIKTLADENIKKAYKIDVISKSGLREKVSTFLQIRSQKVGSCSFHVMMTQEQMAQYLCVNRSALSHELSKMRNEGLINFKRDWYEIL